MSELESAYGLLHELGINTMSRCGNRLSISYEYNNKKAVGFGETQDEVVLNFYNIYHELKDI